MMRIRWGTGSMGPAREKVIDFGSVDTLGGNGSGTFLVFRDVNQTALLVIPGNRLIDAEEMAE